MSAEPKTAEPPEAQWTDADLERLRELVAEEGQRQWQIGDLLLARLPKGKPGVNTGMMAALRQIAAKVGGEPAALRVYRDVAYSWPAATRVAAATWAAHRAYQGSPDGAADRAITIGTLPRNEHGFVTVKAVRDMTKGAGGKPNRDEAALALLDEYGRVVKDLSRYLDEHGTRALNARPRGRYVMWAPIIAAVNEVLDAAIAGEELPDVRDRLRIPGPLG